MLLQFYSINKGKRTFKKISIFPKTNYLKFETHCKFIKYITDNPT